MHTKRDWSRLRFDPPPIDGDDPVVRWGISITYVVVGAMVGGLTATFGLILAAGTVARFTRNEAIKDWMLNDTTSAMGTRFLIGAGIGALLGAVMCIRARMRDE